MSAKLIDNLVADLVPVNRLRPMQFWGLAGLAGLASVAAILMNVGLRADFAGTLQSLPLLWKTLATLALAIVLSLFVFRASQPGTRIGTYHWLVLAMLLAIFWIPGAIGFVRHEGNAVLNVDPRTCLGCIAAAALIPLAAYLFWLRKAAPVHPARAGALAGLAAGAIGAFAFANHCPHLEYQYISVFYTLPSLLLAAIGALLAKWFCTW